MIELTSQYNSWIAPTNSSFQFNTLGRVIPFDHPIHSTIRRLASEIEAKNRENHTLKNDLTIVRAINGTLQKTSDGYLETISELDKIISSLKKQIEILNTERPKTLWEHIVSWLNMRLITDETT